jgi:hypothetical protein
MRKSLILLPLLVCTRPALAQSPAPQLPRELTDPATAQRLQRSMQAMSKALLDLRVGEMQATIDGRAPTKAEKKLTIRDLGRRNDPNFERKLNEGIANAGPMIDRSVKAMNEALPSIMQSVERARDAIERATANMPDPSYPKR